MELRTLLQKLRPIYSLQSRCYSQYSKDFVAPIYLESEQEKLLNDPLHAQIYSHLPIKAARDDESSTVFHDVAVAKFVNYLMRDGKKKLARQNLNKAFTQIKKIQLERYHKANPEEKQNIITDPLRLFKMAVKNSRPLLKLCPIKKGGQTYHIPAPITEHESLFRGMRWMISCCDEKERTTPFYVRLAQEILDTAENKGRTVKKKIDLHKQCEANRAYAHYRWT